MPSLAIIIVEYHCINDVITAVESIHQYLSTLDTQVVIVSNSEYSNDEASAFAGQLPGSKLIINDSNTGYAGGVNRALREINTDYVFLLNPDGRFIDNKMSLLIDHMESDHSIAVIGPKVVDEDGIVQPSCRRFPKPYTFLLVRSFLRKLSSSSTERIRYLMEDFNRQHSMVVDWVSGGAMLVRLQAVTEVGAMDERYFLYMEDVDWCRTFGLNGWKVVYDPASAVLHAGKHSSIQGGIQALRRPTVRWHLQSLFKYFLKFAMQR